MTIAAAHDSESTTVSRGLIVVLNRDLFFGVRIGNTLRDLGYAVAFVPTTGTFVERLRGEGPVALGIIDMSAGVEWELIRELRAEGNETPLLAFGSHTDVDGRRAAKAAGVTRIVSNGEFHHELVPLVRRYAAASSAPTGSDADRSGESA